MSEEVTEEVEETAIALIPTFNAIEAFKAGGMDETLATIKRQIDSEVLKVDTKEGRANVKKIITQITGSKTFVENQKKIALKPLNDKKKVIIDEWNKAEDFFVELKTDTRKVLTDWENVDKDRIAGHEKNLEDMKVLDNDFNPDHTSKTAIQLKANLKTLDDIYTQAPWEEFFQDAKNRFDAVTRNLQVFILRSEKREQEAAELEVLRKKQVDEQKAKDAEFVKLKADEAQRKLTEVNVRVKEQIDTAEAAKVEKEQEERSQDVEHQRKVNREVLESFVDVLGLDRMVTKQVVTAIAQGKIEYVTINY